MSNSYKSLKKDHFISLIALTLVVILSVFIANYSSDRDLDIRTSAKRKLSACEQLGATCTPESSCNVRGGLNLGISDCSNKKICCYLDGNPYPQATSCGSVTVTGAQTGSVSTYYYVESGGSLTLSANTTPENGQVNWKIATYSQLLSSGGSFSVNFVPTTVYTAPINNNDSEQGVQIRGDISEYPDEWLYCPSLTVVVLPQ